MFCRDRVGRTRARETRCYHRYSLSWERWWACCRWPLMLWSFLQHHEPLTLSGQCGLLLSFLCIFHPALQATAGHCFTCTQPWTDLCAWMTLCSRELENTRHERHSWLLLIMTPGAQWGRSTCWHFASLLVHCYCLLGPQAYDCNIFPYSSEGLYPWRVFLASSWRCKDQYALRRTGPCTGWQTPIWSVS